MPPYADMTAPPLALTPEHWLYRSFREVHACRSISTIETLQSLVSPAEATDVIDQLFQDEAKGHVQNKPTTELDIPGRFFRLKAGVTQGFGSYGFC